MLHVIHRNALQFRGLKRKIFMVTSSLMISFLIVIVQIVSMCTRVLVFHFLCVNLFTTSTSFHQHINYWYHNWSVFLNVFSVPNERTVVNKERAAGYYRLSAYYLAKLCSELPLVVFQPTLFVTIVYWMTGLNRSEAFLGTLFVVLLTALTGQVWQTFCFIHTVFWQITAWLLN